MLNIIWIGFFVSAFLIATVKTIIVGDAQVFVDMTRTLFDLAKTAFEIALGLTGVMAFWLGMLRVAERAGVLNGVIWLLAPLFRRLLPEVPKDHPALGSILMNMAANVLGLDNAATPMGLQAMRELQTLNPRPDTATNAQILFLVINTSSITLLPVTIFTYRAQAGAANPTDVFIPILIATYCSTLIGLLVTAAVQRLRFWDGVTLAYLGTLSFGMLALVAYFSQLSTVQMEHQSAALSAVLLMTLITAFVGAATYRRLDVYATFLEGAQEGFQTAIRIIPYLVAMLVAIGLFRASGAMDGLLDGVRAAVAYFELDDRFVPALPTALMKSLSGSGARAMMVETMYAYGADSFAGRLASIVQGSTETTFYVLAVYFGSVGIRNARHAVACALLADLASLIAAILVAYWFFG